MTVYERLRATGFLRFGAPGRFRYRTADGRAPDAATRARIASLKAPPGWTGVAFAASPRATVQAAGRDAAGRTQYLYHPARAARREREKRRRLARLLRLLPRIRRAIERDLRRPALDRRRVCACAVRILERCHLRAGEREYARKNGVFGLATLRPRHVKVVGSTVTFDFPGKTGRRQTARADDARVAATVRALLAGRPREVFHFFDHAGRRVDLATRHVNEYLREASGARITAKDFRTWAGTVRFACAAARLTADGAQGVAARRRALAAAVRETADALGNTPAVCRASYVASSVMRVFAEGGAARRDAVARMLESARSDRDREAVVLRLLAPSSRRRATAAAAQPRPEAARATNARNASAMRCATATVGPSASVASDAAAADPDARTRRRARRSWPAPSIVSSSHGAASAAASRRNASTEPKGSRSPWTKNVGVRSRGQCATRSSVGRRGGWSG
ncbi:MAG TPA: DNA topoisomerase IB [Planctomycetota bacterium]|nr:DNA topoisomerase IB [Planctomycetota bacterium]